MNSVVDSLTRLAEILRPEKFINLFSFVAHYSLAFAFSRSVFEPALTAQIAHLNGGPDSFPTCKAVPAMKRRIGTNSALKGIQSD